LCSFTIIPRDGGREIELNIRHGTFVDKFLKEIASRTPEVDEAEQKITGEAWYDLGSDFFQIYGPFASSDYTIANANRVAVLVQTTGSVVAETVVKFQNIRHYWNKVIVFAVGSDLMDYEPELSPNGQSHTHIFENTDIDSFNREEAKFRWLMNRIDREINFSGDPKAEARIIRRPDGGTFLSRQSEERGPRRRLNTRPLTPREVATSGLTKREKEKLLSKRPFWPNAVELRCQHPEEPVRLPSDIVVFGLQRISSKLAEHILKKLQLADFDVIVCSSAWAKEIHEILKRDKFSTDPEVHLEKTRLHVELFDN